MLAGAVLAEAAMYDGHHVAQTQEYGPEARLGATKAEVIISRRPIAFPQVVVPDILLCLSRDGFLRYGRMIAPGGIRIVEASLDPELSAEQGIVRLPLREVARAEGNELAMNIVGLGALATLTGAVSESALERALGARIKPEFLDLNVRALGAGLALGRARSRAGPAIATHGS